MPKESLAKKKQRVADIVERLKQRYPSAECALEYEGEPWRLLVMGRLSAQCTDARVNIVCRDLFARFPTAQSLADAPITEIEDIVRPCGLFRTKAQNIKDACAMLVYQFGGVLPDDMDTLLTLPGVGRKIANLLLGDIYHRPAIVADTHCIRISERLGLTPRGCSSPEQTERSLIPLISPEEQSDFCHRIVWFGREVCTARSPKCDACPLGDLCPSHINK